MVGSMQPPNAVERMIAYLREIARPIWWDVNNNALRIYITGVTSSSTTIGTLSNQQQIGGVDAKTAYADQIMLNTWCNSVRSLIS